MKTFLNLTVAGIVFILLVAGYVEISSAQVVQQWLNLYNGPSSGDDRGYFIENMPDHGIVAAGTIFGPNQYNYGLLRFTAEGQQLWVVNDPLPGNGYINDMVSDSECNLYVTGLIETGYDDVCTQKYDSSGNLIWSQSYNSPALYEYGYACRLDGAGNLYVAGHVGWQFDEDLMLLKYAAGTGQLLWAKIFAGGGGGTDLATDLAIDAENNVYITGYTDVVPGTGTNLDLLVMKCNSQGDSLWSYTYNGTGNTSDKGTDIAVDAAGNLIVSGNVNQTTSLSDVITMKLSPDGDLIWSTVYDGRVHLWDEINSMALDYSNDAVYVSGRSQRRASANFMADGVCLKYNSAGELLWAQKLGHYADTYLFSVAVGGDGNLYGAGSWDRPGFGGDIMTISYNPEGDIRWIQTSHSGQYEYGFGVAVNDLYDVYVTGHAQVEYSNYDWVTIKYQQTDPPDLAAMVTPDSSPIVIPASGDTFSYHLKITNPNSTPITCMSWVLINLPDGFLWGPTFLQNEVTLAAGDSLQWQIQQVIPAEAPAGTYYLRAYAGADYKLIWCSDHFTFTKLSSAGDVDNGQWPGDFCSPADPAAVTQSSTSGAALTAYPNPFNPITTFSYQLPVAGAVRLTVWDTAGRLVATLVDEPQEAGIYQATFNGSKLTSGVYLVRMQARNTEATQKLVLLK